MCTGGSGKNICTDTCYFGGYRLLLSRKTGYLSMHRIFIGYGSESNARGCAACIKNLNRASVKHFFSRGVRMLGGLGRHLWATYSFGNLYSILLF